MKAIIATFYACVLLLCLTAGGLAQTKTTATGTTPVRPLTPLPVNHGGKIELKYDGFSRETIVKLKQMNVTCGATKGMQGAFKSACISLVASLHCPGQQIDYVRYAKLQLLFETKDWEARHPLGERDLIVIADGERLKLGTMQLNTQGGESGFIDDKATEVLEISFPYQTFLKIARAGTVEMVVGKSVFLLRDKNIAAFRDMNNRIKF